MLQINTELLACLGKRTVLGGNYSLEISSATAKKGRGVYLHLPAKC